MTIYRSVLKIIRARFQNYDFVLHELGHLKLLAALALICSVLVSILDGLGIGLLLTFLQSLTSLEPEGTQTGIHWIDTHVLGVDLPQNQQLIRIAGITLLVTWLRAGVDFLQAMLTGTVEITLLDRLRRRVFEQLCAFRLDYFSDVRSGNLVSLLTNDITKLKNLFGSISFLLVNSVRVTIYGLIIIWISWKLSLTAIALLSILSIVISKLRRYIRQSSQKITIANSEMTARGIEFLSGILTVHAFATQQIEKLRFNRASQQIADAEVEALSRVALQGPLSFGFGSTIILFIIAIGYLSFEVSVAQLLMFVYILDSVVKTLRYMHYLSGQVSYQQGSLHNVRNLVSTHNKPYFANGRIAFSGLKNAFQFCSVSFAYDTNSRILQDINLVIEKGKTTALVGASGSGKSTLASLLCRFYDPQAGQILVDDVDLRAFEITSLRNKIAIVSQETFIFNTSVINNITYGLEDVNDTDVYRAAELANAIDFIQNLPEGFNTVLGDRGVKLSGGQRQRIAISRALLRDPEILILDEATSALDSVSEQLIQKSLEQLSTNRTVIAIAHRLSTITHADKIVVLEKGRIVEQGTYQGLLAQKGKLWDYHKAQFLENADTQFKKPETV
ncbi:ABC transporter ATP-binding protein [Oscillatoria sp. CS-180]|uniref:heterocyst formation ABC transporter subunit HepA n=1 Tax=Oscillatoria sp. CS-180 TaxID=3021720 RepID=UPI00232D8F7E|nr:heterocyst formation ABC transporter subunit HepA [Oscillatoria sp. CS-180]MDB9526192.1 ABC transporter ATP-binding protein [Oscillatoria sp. CS-180]